MLNKELVKAINSQLCYELSSSYIYLGLAGVLEGMKMPGAAHWMRTQAQEELFHANYFFEYLAAHGAPVALEAIPKPELSKVKTALDAFKLALKHEQSVTKRINDLTALAMKSGDFATVTFLHFYVSEQIEEERSAQGVIDKFERAGKNDSALIFIDAELKTRPAATPPANPPIKPE